MSLTKDFDPHTTPLPLDIGGFQALADGAVIQVGDLLVADGTPYCWAYRSLGYTVAEARNLRLTEGLNVYRRMPVPSQGGTDDSWKLAQQAEEFRAGCAPGANVPEPDPISAVTQSFNETTTPAAVEAKTDDGDKLPLIQLPWRAIADVSRVQQFGHRKYRDFNNYRAGMAVSRNLSCAVRHIVKFWLGETNDPESGCHHLAHAACRLLFILENIAEHKEGRAPGYKDDRRETNLTVVL